MTARFNRFFAVPVGEKRLKLLLAWQAFDISANAPCQSTFLPNPYCGEVNYSQEYYAGFGLWIWPAAKTSLQDEQNRSKTWKEWVKESQPPGD